MKYNICNNIGCFGSKVKDPNTKKINKDNRTNRFFRVGLDFGKNGTSFEVHFQIGYRKDVKKNYSDIKKSNPDEVPKGPEIKQIEEPIKTIEETNGLENPIVIETKKDDNELDNVVDL